MTKTISRRVVAWLSILLLLASILPLYALSFYNHACYDDFGFSLHTHAAWQNGDGLAGVLHAAWQNTVGIRQTWEGTYTSSLISARISMICMGSRPTVGSSRTMTLGLPSSACAIPTRCL